MTRQIPLLFWTACVTLLLALAPTVALGADTKPPQKMAFQGFLTDGTGAARGLAAPVNLELTFRLFKSPTAAANTALWSEKQTVTVDKGHFSVVLGDGVLVSGTADFAAHFSGNDTDAGRYLGVQVTGETEIAPRIQFFTAPYASLARYATELVGTAGTSVLKVSNDRAGINLVGAPTTTLDVGGIVTATGLDVNGTSTLDGTTTVAGSLRVTGNNVLELGSGVVGKEGSAGKIGYGTFTTGVLDIVGAGTTGNNRAVKIWAEAGTTFTGPISATTLNGDGSALTGVAKLGANTFIGQQDVQGHLRIGELASSGSSAGWGEALIFSGAPPLSSNADNSDPLWLARYNTAANSSELRMVIGDDPGSSADAFVIGTMVGGNFNQGTFAPSFGFTARGLLDFGYGRTKETSAGTIGYQVHSSDSLDIVGAGTTGSNRKIMMWAEGGAQLNGTLRVTGFANPSVLVEAFLSTGGAGDFPNLPASFANGIVADHGIRAAIFTVASDRRIKNALGQSDGKADLATLKKIEITDYKYRDVVNHGSQTHKKVIAQQVESVYPHAVSVSTGVLPDIYKKATAADGWIQLQADLKAGDRVRVVSGKADQVHSVIAVVNPQPGSREEPKFQLDPPVAEGNVFVYGREMKDFRSVDYEAIAMLNVSATQELARRLEKQDAELAELRVELAKARGEKQSLAENLSAMDARLVRLEKVLKQQAALAPARAEAELVQVGYTKGSAALAK